MENSLLRVKNALASLLISSYSSTLYSFREIDNSYSGCELYIDCQTQIIASKLLVFLDMLVLDNIVVILEDSTTLRLFYSKNA